MNAGAFLSWKLVGLGQLTSGTSSLRESSIDVSVGDVGRNTLPRCVLDCFHHGASTRMAETLVKPEDLTDLVRGDASAALPSQTCAIRSDIRNDAIKPLRILKVKGHSKELADVHIEHIALRINDALMEKDPLQVDP